jgi:hypothetical protein
MASPPRRPTRDAHPLGPRPIARGSNGSSHAPGNKHGPLCSADSTQVIKRMKPGQPGTRGLLQRYGPALVCVRYREDASGSTRFTTVELVVDHGPPRRQPLVRVHIRFDDAETRRLSILLGAEWDDTAKAWRMPRRGAIQLGLIRNSGKPAK